MTQDNKTYQITCFFSPALDKEKLDKQIKEIEELINKQEGSIPDKDLLSRTEKKPLAYPIEKNQEAFYLSFGFSLPSENLDKIYAYLNSEENILRHLITIKQEIKTQPTKKPIDFKIVDKIVR
jgi:ribosomal protein S6